MQCSAAYVLRSEQRAIFGGHGRHLHRRRGVLPGVVQVEPRGDEEWGEPLGGTEARVCLPLPDSTPPKRVNLAFESTCKATNTNACQSAKTHVCTQPSLAAANSPSVLLPIV